MQPIHLVSSSPEVTQRAAEALAPVLAPGDILALSGDLGSGKTCFTQGLARGLGITEPGVVNSPTFVLLNVYQGALPVYHFDAYRLGDSQAWLDLGAEDFLYGDGVSVIEWADRVQDTLPLDRVEVHFGHSGPTTREIRFLGTGERSEEVLRAVEPALSRAIGADE